MLTKVSNKTSWLIFSILILTFVSVQLGIFIHSFKFTDSLHYFYGSKLVSENLVPYDDFLFAHPPLQLYILSLPIEFFGYNHLLLRAMPLLSAVILTLFLFKIAKNNFGNLEALLAAAFFLFTNYVLVNSTYSLGIWFTLTFMIIGLYYFLENKIFWSGIFFGLAAATRLMFLPAFFVILLFSLFKFSENKIKITYKKSIKLFLGFLAVVFPVHLFLLS